MEFSGNSTDSDDAISSHTSDDNCDNSNENDCSEDVGVVRDGDDDDGDDDDDDDDGDCDGDDDSDDDDDGDDDDDDNNKVSLFV